MADIFEGADQTVTPPVTEDKDYFEELVGEGKKYKSPQALARSRVEAENFIETLKRENAELREKTKTAATVEQLMDRINRERAVQTPNREAGSSDNNQNRNGSQQNDGSVQTLKPEDVEKILDEREARRIAERNVEEVKQMMSLKWGPQYVSKLEQVQTDTGITKEDLNALAARSPKAFAKLVGLDQKPTEEPSREINLFTPPRSNTITSVDTNANAGEHNQKWWEDLKKRDRKAYFSDEMTKQRHRDATRLGERFFS